MNNFPYDIGIIGGDMRQVYMANMLAQDGYNLITYGLPTAGNFVHSIASSLHEVIHSSRILAAPIPLTRNQLDITCEQMRTDMTVEMLNLNLTEHHILFAGAISSKLTEYYKERRISAYDYMQNKELTIYNSIATAEGAITLAITKSTVNLHRSRCLVTGYGVCARTLAGYLLGMYADVTVCARDKSARADCKVCGCHAIDFETLEQNIERYDFIFNTVPSVIMPKDLLMKVKKDVVIIDIASAPGGLDYAYAKEAKLNASLCPGLPGIYAPKDSAKALVNFIKSKIQECEPLCP